MHKAAPDQTAHLQTGKWPPVRWLGTFLLHFRPKKVPAKTLEFKLSWGLGGMAAVLVMLQLCTGILLKFAYQPDSTQAYASIVALQGQVLFGKLVRNIHHWSANLLVVIVFLHFLRTVFTSAFLPPRQLNWLTGLGLFAAVLAANFTGYLLPWDQLAFWGVTISTGILEYIPLIGRRMQQAVLRGSEVGPASLHLFYTLHTAVIPAVLVILMAFHFWRVRKAGGLVLPRSWGEKEVASPRMAPAWPDLIVREITVAAALIALVVTLSVFLQAPLGQPANPGMSLNPTKAPWYFAAAQETLMHFHPVFAVFILPLALILGLLVMPYLKYRQNPAGIWFVSPKGRRLAAAAAILSFVATPIFILLGEFGMGVAGWPADAPLVLSTGMIPAAVLLCLTAGFYWISKSRYSASTNESVQAVLILITVSLIVMTIICTWFRGEEMKLAWP